MKTLPLLAALCVAASLPAAAAPKGSAAVKRGAYLTRIMGCADCHTPMKMGAHGPEPDTALMFAGHPAALKLPPAPAAQGPWIWSGAATNTAFAGPWGVTYAANLTSDKATGLGGWTEQAFLDAMRTGRHLGKGRPILPPMPIEAYKHATESDLKAIFAYLRTVPAVANAVPEAEPPAAH